ncbi:hypothetical protein GCM10027063_47000 [Promicromonospora xylanilytica]
MRYSVVNDGTVALRATSPVRASAALGGAAASAPAGEPVEVLPGGRREVSVTVPGIWPIGPYDVEAVVGASVAQGGQEAPAPSDVTLAGTAWALPLPHLLVLLVLVLAGWALRRASRARRTRLDRLIAKARAEGRAEAMAAAG